MALAILIPTSLLLLLCLWTWALVANLRREDSYTWLILLVLLPPLVAPVYLLNYFALGDPIGRAIERARKAQRAAELHREVEEGAPDAVREELAMLLYDMEEYGGALDQLGPLLDRDADSLRLQFMAGRALLELDRPDNAAAHLRYVVEEDPAYMQGNGRLYLALALERLGKGEEAIEQVSLAIRHLELPRFLYEYGRMLIAAGRAEEAKATLRRLLEANQGEGENRSVKDRHWLRAARKLLDE